MNNQKKAVLYVILSAFFFSLMSFFVRLSGDMPTFQKVFFRNAVAAMIAFPVFLKNHGTFALGRERLKLLLLRVCFGTLGIVCNFYAIDHMKLSDANMLLKLSPFFAIIASIHILKEYPKKSDWLVLLVVFSGALLIMKPSMSAQFGYALIAVVAAFGAGTAYTYVRKLGKEGVSGPTVVLAFSLFSCLVALPYCILNRFRMTGQQLLMLLLAGFCAAGGQFSITAAYQKAEAKNISVFEYTQIIFAALWGFLFLDQIPDRLSIAGYLIIIGGSVLKQRLNDNTGNA